VPPVSWPPIDAILSLGGSEMANRRPLLMALALAFALLGAPGAYGGGPQPPPAGTFAGDGLTLTLTRMGNDYTGAAKLGGTTVDLKGLFDPVKGLAGTFTAGGNSFEWIAAVDGNTLKFQTGGTEYNLVIPAADNPLARKPALDNPLAARPAPAQHPDAPGGGGTVKFTRLSVKDPGINNIEAVSFLIPEGWQTQGGIQWLHDYSILANLLMTITDPQTGGQIQFLPIQNLTWAERPVMPMEEGSNYMGSIVHRPMNDIPAIIQTFYVQQVLPQLANLQPIRVEPLTKIEQQIDQAWGGRGKATAARVRYEFEYQGQAWEEDVFLTVVITPPATEFGIAAWYIPSAYSFRAPKGVLDSLEPVMVSVVSTCRLSQDWYSGYMHIQKLFANRMNQDIKNAAALSATITRNREEIRQMYADSYKERQESQDRISEAWGEVIKGVETYKNPYENRPVELPAGYNDVWVNPQGEYLLSNEAGTDPNVGSTVEWRRMEVK
jgi:hypothetical protein